MLQSSFDMLLMNLKCKLKSFIYNYLLILFITYIDDIELLNRGCTYDAERDVILTSSTHRQKTAIVFNNGDLLQTLTECVAQLERKPLSVNIKNEIENAKKRNAASEKAEIMEY